LIVEITYISADMITFILQKVLN